MLWIWIVSLFYFVLIIGAAIWALSTIIALIPAKGVPYVPLNKKQLSDLKKNLKFSSTDKIVDLGSGDGRVLRLFEEMGGKDLTGYELNFWAHLQAKLKNFFKKSRTKVYLKNFNQVDLSQYNIVFCYLLDSCLDSLRGKFDKELKSGTKIISYGFHMSDWHEPEIIYTNKENKNRGRIFIYTIK